MLILVLYGPCKEMANVECFGTCSFSSCALPDLEWLTWTALAQAPPPPGMSCTFHLSHVQGFPKLLQQVGTGSVLLVLLAVVVLLRHARVVEPGIAQLAVAV